MKVIGAAAAEQNSFERCVEIGTAVGAQLISIGSALDHCHVPGRQNHEIIAEDVCIVGAGRHNEPVSCLFSMLSYDCNPLIDGRKLRVRSGYRHSHPSEN